MMEFSAISPSRAVDEIAAQVREMIATGKIKPGDRLPSERDLSARLGVSRNTLREALRALENAGIVEMRKGATGGAFVLHGSSDVIVGGMRDLYHLGAITPQQFTEARMWLSEVVVRVASERATEEDFAALEANIDASAKAVDFGFKMIALAKKQQGEFLRRPHVVWINCGKPAHQRFCGR